MVVQAAVLTAPGAAGIATILLKGEAWGEMLGQIFTSRINGDIPHFSYPNLYLGNITEGAELIDQVMVAPGQDGLSAEIHCHGGERIVQRILRRLGELGAQVRRWEEIPEPRAIAGEIEFWLPRALTKTAALALAAQAPGGLTAWAQDAGQGLAQNSDLLEEIRMAARRLGGTYAGARKLLFPPAVVLAGPVNAGKSTLANALSGTTQSIALDLPGTTRDWTESLIELGGVAVRLIDTAGLRAPQDELEEAAVAGARRQMAGAEVVIRLEEGTEKKTEDRSQESEESEKAIRVFSKADLIPLQKREQGRAYVSARTGEGLEELKRAVAAKLGFADDFEPAAALVFTERQAKWIEIISGAASTEEASRALQSLQIE